MTAKRRQKQPLFALFMAPKLTQQCISICSPLGSSFLSAALEMTADFLPLQDGFASELFRDRSTAPALNGSLLSCCRQGWDFLTLSRGAALSTTKNSQCVWANGEAKHRWWPTEFSTKCPFVFIKEKLFPLLFAWAFIESMNWTVDTKSALILKPTFSNVNKVSTTYWLDGWCWK